MATKNYLPNRVLPFDIEVAKDNIEKRVPEKYRKCVKRFFTIFGLFSLLFGTGFIGLSIVNVGDGQVGYYQPSCPGCRPEIYKPGTYIILPWHKGIFSLKDVSDRNVVIGTLGKNYPFNGTCMIQQHIVNVTEFLEEENLSDTISVIRLKLDIPAQFQYDFTFSDAGSIFTKPYFKRNQVFQI